MSWKLFLDDSQNPPEPGYTVARSSVMAVVFCVNRKQLPEFMSLGYDLDENNNIMRFLKELRYLWEQWGADPALIPKYTVHSADSLAAENIIKFMESWKKSAQKK